MENSNSNMIAPFVMKTYQMLSDPTANTLIAWGRANNSFIVLEPSHFSHWILPLYFKHNNFSSFVRQLNTYGFRKVDPDRWEFANEWFLRGQIHLLNKIVRRKHTSRAVVKHEEEEDDDNNELVMEITKLKHEQQSLEQELESMKRRVEATERRPQQMMTFLCRVVEDPQSLLQIMLDRQNDKHLNYDSCSNKKRKIMVCAASSSSSSSAKSDEEDRDAPIPLSDPDLPVMNVIRGYESGGGVRLSYFEALVDDEKASQQPPPYPFSLLDGGF